MVEVEIVEQIMQANRDGKDELVDVRVEVKEVFTGPQSLKGEQILINPIDAYRFPPERWSALGMVGVMGSSVENFREGKRGLLWIFQRQELLTGIGQGRPFQFFTGFRPAWKSSRDDADYLQQLWEETHELMQILKAIEALDDTEKEQAVVPLLESENRTVRQWALAALARVKGPDVLPILEQFRDSEVASGIGGYPWARPGEQEDEIVSLPPLLGVEIMTAPTMSGPPNFMEPPPHIIEPGTVKVLHVFSGSGVEVGEILPAETGNFEPGTKFLVMHREGDIHLLDEFAGSWAWDFPPQGRWDGENKRLSNAPHIPHMSIDPLLPWLNKISNGTGPSAGDFLDEAIRHAPWRVAMWVLNKYPYALRPDTMEWLEESLGVNSQTPNPDASLLNMFLYDKVMGINFRQLWQWNPQRDWIMEQILSYPLTNDDEAWLLYTIFETYSDVIPSKLADRWIRLAEAARNNTSWRQDWIHPHFKRRFEHIAWSYTLVESRATFDPAPAIAYLLDRWAIPDRDEPGTPILMDHWGSGLARSLPLQAEDVEKLRAALSARLASSGTPPEPESVESRLNEIQAMTWQEIVDQPFP